MQRTVGFCVILLFGLSLSLIGPSSAGADRDWKVGAPRQSPSNPGDPHDGDRLRRMGGRADSLRTGLPAPSAVTGSRKVVVLRAFWRRSAPSTPTARKLREQVDRASDSFDLLSNGRMRLARATVSPWLKIASPKRGSCMDQYARFENLTYRAAKRKGIHLGHFDHVLMYLPCVDGFAAGLGDMPGDTVWLFSSSDPGVITHEIGHNLGLDHANRHRCRKSGRTSSFRGRCYDEEYGDPYDVMGVMGSALSSASLDRLGWLTGRTAANRSGSYSIHTLSRPGGSRRALRIRTANKTYWIDYRTAEGADVNEYLTPEQVSGVQVREVVGRATRLIDAAPGSWDMPDGNEDGYNALPPGSSITLPGGVRLTVTAQDDDQTTIKVQRGRSAAKPARPRDVTATAGPRSVAVSWGRPDDNGAIIGRYEVTASVGNKVVERHRTRSLGGRQTTFTFWNLDPAEEYRFRVRAFNEYGGSQASSLSGPVTPNRRGLTVNLVEPWDGTIVRGGTPVSFNVVRDPADRSPMVSAKLLVDGTPTGSLEIFSQDDYGSGHWTPDESTTTEHTLQIRATDEAGTTSLSEKVTVTVKPVAYSLAVGPTDGTTTHLAWSGADTTALTWISVAVEDHGDWWSVLETDPTTTPDGIDFDITDGPGTYRVRVTSYFSWDDGGYYEDTRYFDVTVQ